MHIVDRGVGTYEQADEGGEGGLAQQLLVDPVEEPGTRHVTLVEEALALCTHRGPRVACSLQTVRDTFNRASIQTRSMLPSFHILLSIWVSKAYCLRLLTCCRSIS